MKKIAQISIAFIFCACASGHHAPFEQPLPSKRNLVDYSQRLQRAVSSCPQLSVQEIGWVVYPGFQAPLWRISFRPDSPDARQVLISAGIHGNEPAGAECALQFVEKLAATPETFGQMAFDVVPLVNPWGWVHDIRFNREGTDVYRDFASDNAQETRIIKHYLQGKQYDMMLDLHEDPGAEGFYVYQYALADSRACRQAVAAVRRMGYPIEQNVKMVVLKTDDGVIDAPRWGLTYMQLSGQLSITNYYRLNHSQYVFTVETPTRLQWADRLQMQQTAVHIFLENIDRLKP